MAVEYYDMRHEGSQIDDAVDLVLSGDIKNHVTLNYDLLAESLEPLVGGNYSATLTNSNYTELVSNIINDTTSVIDVVITPQGTGTPYVVRVTKVSTFGPNSAPLGVELWGEYRLLSFTNNQGREINNGGLQRISISQNLNDNTATISVGEIVPNGNVFALDYTFIGSSWDDENATLSLKEECEEIYSWVKANVFKQVVVRISPAYADVRGSFLTDNIYFSGTGLVLTGRIWLNDKKKWIKLTINHNDDHTVTFTKEYEHLFETLSNGNIKVEGIGEFMAATPSGNPNHMLYLDAGLVWNAETNYWEYGGIVNITTDELRKAWLEAYTLQGGSYLVGWFRQSLSRINICRARWSSVDSIQRMFELANTLEVAVLADKNRTALPSIIDSAFYGCRKLKSIATTLDMQYCKTATSAFVSCFQLEDVIINNLKISLGFADSSMLSKSSLLNLIQKATPTSAITITVHADVYAWASTDAEIQVALEAQPLVTLISA